MSEIKAIETYYKGYRFRSRLEARWAVFFDAAGIKYEYEPEGFGLEDGRERTLEEVGQKFGVTRERVRQIEKKALNKLRAPVKRAALAEFLKNQ